MLGSSPRRPQGRSELPVTVLATYFGLAALFTAAIIQYSRSYGRMLLGPLYDDVVYLNEGLQYAQLLQTTGIQAAVTQVWQSPPHSPFATLVATVSFLILGPLEWAPYALMSLVVLATLLAADYFVRDLPRHARVAAAVFVLSFPIVVSLPYHFRPDATAGLVTGFAVMLMIQYSPLWAPRRHQYLTGACFGVALLVKTPVFPFTLLMGGASWLLSMIRNARPEALASSGEGQLRPTGWRIPWNAAWPYAGAGLIVAGPYYALAGRRVLYYIYTNMFGEYRDLWALGASGVRLARYLWDGQGGQLMLGSHGYVVAGLATGAGVIACRTHGIRGAAARYGWTAIVMLGALLLAWIVPTLSRYGNPFIGATFAALVLFLGVSLLWHLFLLGGSPTSPPGLTRLGGGLGWCAVALALGAFHWPLPGVGTRSTEWVITSNRVERSIYQTIAEHSGENPATVFMTKVADISAHLLQFRARARQAPLTFIAPPLSGDMTAYRRAIATSDYVVAGETGALRENPRFPGFQVQDEVLKEVRRDPGLTLIATVPAHNGRNLYVFGREAAFGGWVSAQGLAPLQGPFRWAGNRMVRWGLGPETRLVVRSTTVRSGTLEFSGLTMRRDNVVQVVVNGDVAGQMPLRARHRFQAASFPVTWQVGENVVELRYAVWEPGSDGSGAAVLFKVLRAR